MLSGLSVDNMPPRLQFLGSTFFGQLASEAGLELLDVGSRGGILEDFLPAAAFTNAIGFEPDEPECERMNEAVKKNGTLWKSERHYPVALGEKNSSAILNLTREPACSSTFQPNLELLRELGRAEDFSIASEIPMVLQPLDIFCQNNGIIDADFLKVDVQGSELAILKGGPKIVGEHLLGIRAEVEFGSLYLNQPLFSEVEMHLRSLGFYLADWAFQRHWRHRRPAEHASWSRDKIPFSRGRLVHADALFLRDHRWVARHMATPSKKLVRLALIALLYQHVDLAGYILRSIEDPKLKSRIDSTDLDQELGVASKILYRKQLRDQALQFYRMVRRRLFKIN